MQIQWSKKALKQLLKLNNLLAQKQITNAVGAELPEFKNSSNVLPLTNHQHQYRLPFTGWALSGVFQPFGGYPDNRHRRGEKKR